MFPQRAFENGHQSSGTGPLPFRQFRNGGEGVVGGIHADVVPHEIPFELFEHGTLRTDEDLLEIGRVQRVQGYPHRHPSDEFGFQASPYEIGRFGIPQIGLPLPRRTIDIFVVFHNITILVVIANWFIELRHEINPERFLLPLLPNILIQTAERAAENEQYVPRVDALLRDIAPPQRCGQHELHLTLPLQTHVGILQQFQKIVLHALGVEPTAVSGATVIPAPRDFIHFVDVDDSHGG
mmetsp:Transcript_5808/g.6645  ORF Transcript_5808/g.6645 Transcript_5808/m.6645 type:complete len:238 (-) Transcript_5808:910-1623(-)